jgi:hypothetical protein
MWPEAATTLLRMQLTGAGWPDLHELRCVASSISHRQHPNGLHSCTHRKLVAIDGVPNQDPLIVLHGGLLGITSICKLQSRHFGERVAAGDDDVADVASLKRGCCGVHNLQRKPAGGVSVVTLLRAAASSLWQLAKLQQVIGLVQQADRVQIEAWSMPLVSTDSQFDARPCD